MSELNAETFISLYRGLNIDKSRDNIKNFNRQLANHKYILIHPFRENDDNLSEPLSILVGFSDEIKILKYGAKTMREVYSHVKNNHFFMISNDISTTLAETLVIETSSIEPIYLEDISWDYLLNAPTISIGEFWILNKPFVEFFRVEETYNEERKLSKFFSNESNKPEGLEIKVVWHDVDDNCKYGNIISLIIWENETIGWISTGGRWLEDHSANTINLDKWTEMMQCIYSLSGYSPTNETVGVSVWDITKDKVDDVCVVPGVSSLEYV